MPWTAVLHASAWIAKHYGKTYSLQALREKCFITREGVSLLGISDAAENIGLHTLGVRLDFNKLCEEAPLPCILHWKQRHFVVVYKIDKNRTLIKTDETDKSVKICVNPRLINPRHQCFLNY